MRPLFSRSSIAVVRLIVALTFAIGISFLDVRFESFKIVRDTIKTALWPIEQAARAPLDLVMGTAQWLKHRDLLNDRLYALVLENQRLQVEQLKLQTLRAENSELRRLLGVTERGNQRFLQAELKRFSNDPSIHRVTLNRGYLAGVEMGMPVLSADGLIGQVVSVYPQGSEVLLVTDSTHQLPVQFTRTRDRAIAVGVGRIDRLEMRNLPDTIDLRPGDLVETSGLGGRFPAGIPVAEVMEIIRLPGQPFVQVVARPLAAMSRLSLVMINVAETAS